MTSPFDDTDRVRRVDPPMHHPRRTGFTHRKQVAIAVAFVAGAAALFALLAGVSTFFDRVVREGASVSSFCGPTGTAPAPPSRPEGRPSRWCVPVGGAANVPPVGGDGIVFVPGRGGLLALDAATGAERWQSESGGSPDLAILDDGALYLRTSGHRTILAVDAATGARWWHYSVAQNERVVGLSVAGETVVVEVVLDVAGRPRADASVSRLVALDAATGLERWRLPAAVSPPVALAVAASGDAVYVATGRALIAFDPATGKERWRLETEIDEPGILRPNADTVYLAAWGRVLAVDAATGKPRWDHQTDWEWATSIALADGVVLVHLRRSADVGNALIALDAATGVERWRTESAGGMSGPVVGGGTVYVEVQGDLLALDAASGRTRWRAAGWGGQWPPLVAGGTVHAMVLTGRYGNYTVDAIGLDAGSGKRRWRLRIGQVPIGSVLPTKPVLVGDVVCLSTGQDGRLACVVGTDPSATANRR